MARLCRLLVSSSSLRRSTFCRKCSIVAKSATIFSDIFYWAPLIAQQMQCEAKMPHFIYANGNHLICKRTNLTRAHHRLHGYGNQLTYWLWLVSTRLPAQTHFIFHCNLFWLVLSIRNIHASRWLWSSTFRCQSVWVSMHILHHLHRQHHHSFECAIRFGAVGCWKSLDR